VVLRFPSLAMPPTNPPSSTALESVKEHEKHRQRRAITDEKTERLLAVAPPERRIIYLMALHSGLRRNEMELWEWQDVFLDVPSPFIKLRVGTTKNRKGDEGLHGLVVPACRGSRSLSPWSDGVS
jgi:integrase